MVYHLSLDATLPDVLTSVSVAVLPPASTAKEFFAAPPDEPFVTEVVVEEPLPPVDEDDDDLSEVDEDGDFIEVLVEEEADLIHAVALRRYIRINSISFFLRPVMVDISTRPTSITGIAVVDVHLF
jgi:hypothetical protein